MTNNKMDKKDDLIIVNSAGDGSFIDGIKNYIYLFIL